MTSAFRNVVAVNDQDATAVDLQSLVETHDQPFIVIDRQHRIQAVNRAYQRTFGVNRSELVGQACCKAIHNSGAPCSETGHDCPHGILFAGKRADGCLQLERESATRGGGLRMTAYLLHGADGTQYVGERIEPVGVPRRQQPSRNMAGESPAFRTCLEQLRMAAGIDAPVLLQGETGTGKELAAEFIHAGSRRRDGPFLTIDCTVLTETLFEAEVFGHARGAFTGSVGERIGLFEQAHGGTLFLDEMGELPLSQQAKLLRVLETGQFRRVGGRDMRHSNVRIICATNRRLLDAVRAGRFREDLYYRIACMAVRIPPLRERLEDIDALAPVLLEPIVRTMHQPFRLTPGALRLLHDHDYPGNIRELRNILFDAAANSDSAVLDEQRILNVLRQHRAGHGQPVRQGGDSKASAAPSLAGLPSESLREVEAYMIAGLLDKYAWSRKKVAAVMGISERTLYRKIRRYEISR